MTQAEAEHKLCDKLQTVIGADAALRAAVVVADAIEQTNLAVAMRSPDASRLAQRRDGMFALLEACGVATTWLQDIAVARARMRHEDPGRWPRHRTA